MSDNTLKRREMIWNYIRTLTWVNKRRVKRGLRPLLKLPKDTGTTYFQRSENCPIARALQEKVPSSPRYVDEMIGWYDQQMFLRFEKRQP